MTASWGVYTHIFDVVTSTRSIGIKSRRVAWYVSFFSSHTCSLYCTYVLYHFDLWFAKKKKRKKRKKKNRKRWHLINIHHLKDPKSLDVAVNIYDMPRKINCFSYWNLVRIWINVECDKYECINTACNKQIWNLPWARFDIHLTSPIMNWYWEIFNKFNQPVVMETPCRMKRNQTNWRQ